jgi:hypothetical protein
MAKQRHRRKGDNNMALTRKFLTALNIDADKIDEIITAHSETVDALKAERDNYKAEAEANNEAKANADKLQKQVDELTEQVKANGKDAYKVKYEAVKEEFDDFKKAIKAEKTKAEKTDAYRKLLKEAGVADKRIESVLKVSDIDNLKINEDGTLDGADDLKKSIVAEWADFIEKTGVQGASTATPPTSTGNGAKTKDEILKIKDTTERQKAWGEYLANQQKGN